MLAAAFLDTQHDGDLPGWQCCCERSNIADVWSCRTRHQRGGFCEKGEPNFLWNMFINLILGFFKMTSYFWVFFKMTSYHRITTLATLPLTFDKDSPFFVGARIGLWTLWTPHLRSARSQRRGWGGIALGVQLRLKQMRLKESTTPTPKNGSNMTMTPKKMGR